MKCCPCILLKPHRKLCGGPMKTQSLERVACHGFGFEVTVKTFDSTGTLRVRSLACTFLYNFAWVSYMRGVSKFLSTLVPVLEGMQTALLYCRKHLIQTLVWEIQNYHLPFLLYSELLLALKSLVCIFPFSVCTVYALIITLKCTLCSVFLPSSTGNTALTPSGL